MQNNRLHYLLQLYFSNTLTDSEKLELALIIDSLEDEQLENELALQRQTDLSEEELSQESSRRIVADILSNNPEPIADIGHRAARRWYLRVAAAAAVVLLLISAGYILFNSHSETKPVYAVVAKAEIVSPDRPTSYTRNLLLPDGSTIVLKAGSTVKYPDRFTGSTREVELRGEAYFDIAHNKAKPFIIHTGTVTTTVLGTAFNIKAWPGQKRVIVSVTRGRVRVEEGHKVLAVLTVNQEVQYNATAEEEKPAVVPADKLVTDWTKEDMEFDHMTLGTIAQHLSKRYGIEVAITNSQLAAYEIVASFSGTESLQNVLDVLCAITPKTHFKIKDKTVEIYNN